MHFSLYSKDIPLGVHEQISVLNFLAFCLFAKLDLDWKNYCLYIISLGPIKSVCFFWMDLYSKVSYFANLSLLNLLIFILKFNLDFIFFLSYLLKKKFQYYYFKSFAPKWFHQFYGNYSTLKFYSFIFIIQAFYLKEWLCNYFFPANYYCLWIFLFPI